VECVLGAAQFPGLLPEGKISVPTGCGLFSRQWDMGANRPATDLAGARRNAETRYAVTHFASMPRGGHFPAMEQPALWVEDLRAFVRDVKQSR
jgi:epoxide hydrolase